MMAEAQQAVSLSVGRVFRRRPEPRRTPERVPHVKEEAYGHYQTDYRTGAGEISG
ncbi:hypothetical protein E05_41760 [Plautia stali symbiont]|nr:hypothetical protein E05_41760 [Plautia stali symbiont]